MARASKHSMLPDIDLLTTAAGQVTAGPVSFPTGVITSIQPVVRSGTARGGAIYLQVFALMSQDPGDIHSVLWAGYVRTKHTPASVPFLPVTSGMHIYCVATALTGYGSVRITVRVAIDPDASVGGGSYIHQEAPRAGPPALREVNLGDPAAGAEYPTQTIPAFTVSRIAAFRGSLSTDATATTRLPRVFTDNGSTQFAGAVPPAGVGASAVGDFIAGRGLVPSSSSTSGITFAPPDIDLATGNRVSFSTVNLAAGDNWGLGWMVLEEWAVPW